jgi:putative transposase
MPRRRRIVPDNAVHHVLNRGNRRAEIFKKAGDYDDFLNLLANAIERVPMRILAVCVMPTHFHLLLWPLQGVDLSAYMNWLMNAHVRRYHQHYGTTGLGHIYQGRYKNFLVQSDAHLYRVLRYVEANARTAGLVPRAELWRGSSLCRRYTPDGRAYLSEWPVPRPADWGRYVNEGIDSHELAGLRECSRRGRPYGDPGWTVSTATKHGLESTVRDRGRPRKKGTAPFSPFE